MFKVNTIHNVIGLLVDTYGGLLGVQEQENSILRIQNQQLQAANQELAKKCKELEERLTLNGTPKEPERKERAP